MNKKSMGNNEHKVNINLFKPEPNASIWGCITGKSKWSDFLKPQIDGQMYKVDFNLQPLGKDNKLSKTRKRPTCMKQVMDSQEKKLTYKTIKESRKSATNIYVKNLISNSTFATNVSHKIPNIPKFTRQQDANKMSLPVYKLRGPKSEGPTTTQLKFKDNVIHLYNVKGMKHKKVILQGLPVNNILPSLMKNRKHVGFQPIYYNPMVSKSKLAMCNENRNGFPNINKHKKESSSRLKNAEQDIAIPQLLSKIQSMEQQIHMLEDTTKKMDKEVNSTKSLCLERSKQAAQQLPVNRKSIVMISCGRSKLLPVSKKKTPALRKKKLKDRKLLTREFTKAGMKIKTKRSKLEISKTTKNDYEYSLERSTEGYDLLAKNFKNKVNENVSNSDTQIKLMPINNNQYCNICNQEQPTNKNFPHVLEINSNKVDLNSKADKNKTSGFKKDLEAENIMINSEQGPQINTYLHSTEDYNSLPSSKKNFNIMRTALELQNIKEKSQQLHTENKVDGLILDQNEFNNYLSQHITLDSSLDSNENGIISYENTEPVQSSRSHKTEFVSRKCDRKSVSILNTKTHDMVPVNDADINQQQENCEGLSKPDTKFNITIYINEKDDISNKSKIFGQYKNLQLIESHLHNTNITSNRVIKVHEAQNVKADATAKNFYKCTSIKEKKVGLNACYKPVSCPGEFDKVKMKSQPGTNSEINNDRAYNLSNALQPTTKSDYQIQEPVSKPYLSRKQRKDIQNRNEMCFQTRFKFNVSWNKSENTKNVKKDEGDTYPFLKTIEKDIHKYGINNSKKLLPFCDKRPKNISKTDLNVDHFKFCNIISDNDYRFGDTERHLGIILDGFQTCVNKTVTDKKKPFCSYNEMSIKEITHRQGDQNSFYCHEHMFSNKSPLRCPENHLPEMWITGQNNNTNINNAKFISENFNSENDMNYDKSKRNVNVLVKNLKNEFKCHQLNEHAEKNVKKLKENNYNSNNKSNIEMFSSIVDTRSESETLQRTSVINNSKTMFDYTISKSSAVENKDQSTVDKNNKKTYRIKLSTLVNKRRTKRKSGSNSNEYIEGSLDLNHSIKCKNLSQISLPVKKCGGLLKINDQDGNDLKTYFAKLSNSIMSGDKSIGMDSGYSSSKNKNDEMISETVTCIREMTINQVVDKNSSKECKNITDNENIRQKTQKGSESDITENTNNSSSNQKTISQLTLNNYQNNMDLGLSKDEINKRKCECCVDCKKKTSESIKCKNSETGNCSLKELHKECLLLLKNQNKLDSEISCNKHPLKNNSNLFSSFTIPILKSPSDFKLKETKTVQQNGIRIPNQLLKYYEFPYSKENLLRPVLISCYNFSSESTGTQTDSPTPMKEKIVEDRCYNLKQSVNSPIFTDNVDNSGVFCDKKSNLNAIVTSLSNSVLGRKYSTNIFGSLEEINNSEILNSCTVQKKMSNKSFEKLKSKFIANNYDVEQSIIMSSFENKSCSSSSVVKSNKIKQNCDVRQCSSESGMCFPSISPCSSSNSTLSSDGEIHECKIGTISSKTKKFLQELQQKIASIKVSSEQSRDHCQIMMEIYNNACEFQKISNEWVNLFNKVNETVCDTDNLNLTNKETKE